MLVLTVSFANRPNVHATQVAEALCQQGFDCFSHDQNFNFDGSLLTGSVSVNVENGSLIERAIQELQSSTTRLYQVSITGPKLAARNAAKVTEVYLGDTYRTGLSGLSNKGGQEYTLFIDLA